MSTKIRSLEGMSFDDLFEAWQLCFIDYGLNLTKESLSVMLNRRGFTQAISYGGFCDEKLISLTFNCVGQYNGVLTAYDTSTATSVEFRRKGLAKQIFETFFPVLQQNGVKQYVLECLIKNSAAVALYTKLGFTILRELITFKQPEDDVVSALTKLNKQLPKGIEIREIDGLPENSALLQEMWDFSPSWQNSIESVQSKLMLWFCFVLQFDTAQQFSTNDMLFDL